MRYAKIPFYWFRELSENVQRQVAERIVNRYDSWQVRERISDELYEQFEHTLERFGVVNVCFGKEQVAYRTYVDRLTIELSFYEESCEDLLQDVDAIEKKDELCQVLERGVHVTLIKPKEEPAQIEWHWPEDVALQTIVEEGLRDALNELVTTGFTQCVEKFQRYTTIEGVIEEWNKNEHCCFLSDGTEIGHLSGIEEIQTSEQ